MELDKKGSYDFSKCLYDLNMAKRGNLFIAYPELSAYEEFMAAENEDEIRIVICICDAESPFLKIKDFKQKLIAVFNYLEIYTLKDPGLTLFEEVFNYTNDRISEMCGIYLQMQNNHDFTYWWNTNQLYYSLMNEMGKAKGKDELVGPYVDRKLKIQKQADPIKNDLLRIEADLFSDSKMKMAIAKSKLTKTRTFAEMHADDNQVI